MQEDPAGLGLNVEVVEVGRVVGSREAVSDGPVVVGVLVGGRDAKDVGSDVGVLLHVLHVFLKKSNVTIISGCFGSFLVVLGGYGILLMDLASGQCDQIGRFFALWATIQIQWQQLFYPNCPHC